MGKEEIKVLSGEVLSIGYNTIHIKEDETKQHKTIFFDGLWKRVLNGYGEDILKRLKRIEWIDTEEFWNVGINFLVCCDRCKNALFSLNTDDDFDDKNECKDCGGWFCSDCINEDGLCDKCLRKRLLRRL